MSVSIIQFPSGSYGYVGSVPVNLGFAIEGATAQARNRVAECVKHSGPGIARKMAANLDVSFSERVFETEAMAREFAEEFRRCRGIEFEIN